MNILCKQFVNCYAIIDSIQIYHVVLFYKEKFDLF